MPDLIQQYMQALINGFLLGYEMIVRSEFTSGPFFVFFFFLAPLCTLSNEITLNAPLRQVWPLRVYKTYTALRLTTSHKISHSSTYDGRGDLIVFARYVCMYNSKDVTNIG